MEIEQNHHQEGTDMSRPNTNGQKNSILERVNETKESSPTSSPTSSPNQNHGKIMSMSTTGFWTYIVIIASWTCALILAICHFLLFYFLNNRKVDDVLVSQSYISAASIAITFLFKTCLSTCIWAAFTQYLWKLLRMRSAKVSTIDDLVRLPHAFTSIFNFDVVIFSPWLYFCALLGWAAAIATIFPPGALVVNLKTFENVQNMSVPIHDMSFRGSGTLGDLRKNALFTMYDSGAYFNAGPKVSRLTRLSIVSQAPVASKSPCGQNCSFVVTVPGPSLQCETGIKSSDAISVNLNQQVYFGNTTIRNDAYNFEAKWAPISNYSTNFTAIDFQNISCAYSWSMYTLSFRYENGVQMVDQQGDEEFRDILRASTLSATRLFNPYGLNSTINDTSNAKAKVKAKRQEFALTGEDLLLSASSVHTGISIFDPALQAIKYNESILYPGSLSLTDVFRHTNAKSVNDAFAKALSGVANNPSRNVNTFTGNAIGNNIDNSFKIFDEPSTTSNTSTSASVTSTSPTFLMAINDKRDSLILDSSMATFNASDDTEVRLKINQQYLQEALRNVTISLFSTPNTEKFLPVTMSNNYNVYSFARKANLIAPYILALFFSLAIALVGILSLRSNGMPATTGGGFLQILCATRISQTLDQLAATPRSENNPDLLSLKVVYGKSSVVTIDGRQDHVFGFGTESEVSRK